MREKKEKTENMHRLRYALWLRDDTFDCILKVNTTLSSFLEKKKKKLKIKRAAVSNSQGNLTTRALQLTEALQLPVMWGDYSFSNPKAQNIFSL